MERRTLPKAAETADTADEQITVARAAALLGVGPQRIYQLVREGYIPRPEAGRYSLFGVVQGRLKQMTDEKKHGEARKSENRVRDARAREYEIRNAKASHELVDTEEAIALVDSVVGSLRTDLSGLPAMVSRDKAIRLQVENSLHDIFEKAATRLTKEATNLRTRGETIDVPEEVDG